MVKVYDDMGTTDGIMITNEDAVRNYIKNLFSVRVGEMPFNREFGTYLEDYLFSPMDFATQKRIEIEVERVIGRWLPMVILHGVKVIPDPDNEVIEVVISFSIDKLSGEQTTSLNFNLK